MNIYQNPEIVHQGIDFFVVDYFAKNVEDYNDKFLPIIEKLSLLKEKAKLKNDFGVKFIKDDLGLKFGDFFISSKGTGRFAFYMENQDYRFFISKSKLNSEIPQVRVEIPAKTIFVIGIHKALILVQRFINKLIGVSYIRKVSRLDLATDVWGIQYTSLDLYRFQTLMSQTSYISEYSIASYMRFNRFTGIQFGRGSKVFRIYDKTHKISISPGEAYIKEKWKINNYDESKNYPVFRHEIQFRREEIKKYIPVNVIDEVDFVLRNISAFWVRALKFVEFVNLNDDEVLRIANNPIIKSNTKKMIFYRAKKDNRRFHFWKILFKWDNLLSSSINKVKKIKDYAFENVKKQFKAFISTFYKVYGSNTIRFSDVVNEVEKELYLKENVTLHEYGLSKLGGSFLENVKALYETGEVVPLKTYDNIVNSYDDFLNSLNSINNPKYKRIFKKVLENV